jgi:predicted peptidase
MKRRTFLVSLAGLTVASTSDSIAVEGVGAVKEVTAITQVFGNGQRLTALVLDYDTVIDSATLSPSAFSVAERTVTRVYANETADLAVDGRDGRFVIIELSPADKAAPTYIQVKRDVVRKQVEARVIQAAAIRTAAGEEIAVTGTTVKNTVQKNLIIDDFKPLVYTDPATGKTLAYNLFIPRDYDPSKRYPLVNFMHDAGVISTEVDRTLVQGLGAVIWADPAEQAKRPCFVVAPQFPEQFVNDQSEESPYLDLVVGLVKQVAADHSIDTDRLYTTGQSGGGMLSIAINIKYPDLFAAAFLVACQWAPELCKPLAAERMWVVVSAGDIKAYPGQNAIMAVIEAEGAKVSRAEWNGRATPTELSAAAAELEKTGGTPILYAHFATGTVSLPGQIDDPGSNHVNTWRIAYQIEPIRDWLFRQSKT